MYLLYCTLYFAYYQNGGRNDAAHVYQHANVVCMHSQCEWYHSTLSLYFFSPISRTTTVTSAARIPEEDAYYHARITCIFLTRSKENPWIDAQMMRLAAYILWRGQ